MSSEQQCASKLPKDRTPRKNWMSLFLASALGISIGAGMYTLVAKASSEENHRSTNHVPLSRFEAPASASHLLTDHQREELKPQVLPGPSLTSWKVANFWPTINDDKKLLNFSKNYPVLATAKDYLPPLFRYKKDKLYVVGCVRYGYYVRATQSVEAPGCNGGKWHKIAGDALVCTKEGFEISDGPLNLNDGYAAPDIKEIEPFLYAKATKGAPRFVRIPTADEEKILAIGDFDRIKKVGVVQQWLNGAYFVAIEKTVNHDDRSYYRTAMGYYLRKEDAEPLKPTQMHGEFLAGDRRLPLAFVYGKDREMYCLDEDEVPRKCGIAKKHARTFVSRIIEWNKKKFVVGPEGKAILRDQVRLTDRIDRPSGIPKNSKWMHLDLSEQTLVAYDGNKPVLATLISSGLDTHATPTGTYRIERRYLTKTMSGPDPDHGVYEVAEVPWTMYYRGNYAIHGAYWHNVFGEKRSHGCTNVPPADSRWIFRWLEPKLPRGWHALLHQEKGWAHFTD